MNGYNPFHSVQDETKLAKLVESMQSHGWVGGALVADGDHLITGAHRYAAAIIAEIEVPVVDIRDICPEWDAIHADFDCPTSNEPDYVCALREISQSVRDEYGIEAE